MELDIEEQEKTDGNTTDARVIAGSFTYKGKLFKIYSMFEHISEQGSPYEGVLKEASEDFDNLNQALFREI